MLYFKSTKKKALTLIFCFYVMIILLGLSTIAFMRMANENKLSQINFNSKQAFYEAEAGISYAYAESARNGFNWYTHDDKNTVSNSETMTTLTNSFIDTDDGCYKVTGHNFKAKAYPERIDGNLTGVIVILSQGISNGITRTVEYRLGQKSAYEYLLFFPQNKSFGDDTYNGRNFGGMHINGNIELTGIPKFYYLTKLTAGSNDPNEGFLFRKIHSQYPDYHGEMNYSNSIAYPQQLNYYLYTYSNTHIYEKNTIFRTGSPDNYTETILPPYLSGPEAYWEYDKYAGAGSNTAPMSYTITDNNLKNLGIYEMIKGDGSIPLFSQDNNQKITVTHTDGTPASSALLEKEAFEFAYNSESDGNSVDWNQFWNNWKAHHNQEYNDYAQLSGNQTSDWERLFFMAAYNWTDTDVDGIPDTINKEWWEDMSYGDDRATLNNDKAPAALEDPYTNDVSSNYFLNSKQQTTSWGSWLEENSLNSEGDNRTLVQDASQGGKYIDQGEILSTAENYDYIKQKALNGGIYIGYDENSGEFVNPISDCLTEANFYNAQNTALENTMYKPSSILKIDIQLLKEKIDSDKQSNGPLAEFNGIIYIDLNNYSWTVPRYDSKADGVMIINGERLPDGGLSLVTPNSVYIKGNFNLDPTGNIEKNREPDDINIINHTIDQKTYINSQADFSWQPAEIITRRPIYTVSENFSEPQTMPLLNSHYYQYYDESQGYTDADIIDHPRWGTPGAGWMPSSTDTSWNNLINDWFSLSSASHPAIWSTAWIEETWGTYNTNDSYVYKFGEDENTQYIMRTDLKTNLYNKINQYYNTEYNYAVSNSSSDYQKSNTVLQPHIYNTAIITPYSTDTYSLEDWGNKKMTINGAFIKLPDNYKYPVPNLSYQSSSRSKSPTRTFNYETRYGKNGESQDIPRVRLTFGSNSSWREVNDF